MPIGPKGEKRPSSPVSNAIHVMMVAAGLKKEEYVDGRPWTDDEVIALRAAETKKRKKKNAATK